LLSSLRCKQSNIKINVIDIVLRRMYGPKREEVVGGWRRLHNEELHNLYALPIIRVIKSRGLRCVGHKACIRR
jgi:hypothetical protein